MPATAPFLALVAVAILGAGCSAAATVIAANPAPPPDHRVVPASTVADRHPANIEAGVPAQALWIEAPFPGQRTVAPQRVDAGTTRTLRRGRVGLRDPRRSAGAARFPAICAPWPEVRASLNHEDLRVSADYANRGRWLGDPAITKIQVGCAR